jgi:hypothetical protein
VSDLGATLEELLRIMKARNLRVPAEIGTFVALECAERLIEGPAVITMKDVRVSEEGLVSLFVTPRSASAEAAAQSLVGMLATLLVAAGTAVPAPLMGIVESGAGGGAEALVSLRDALGAALVPLNRQAARRVLSRMIREARRPATERPPELRSGGVDDALDALLGEGSGPPSDPNVEGRSTDRSPGSVDAVAPQRPEAADTTPAEDRAARRPSEVAAAPSPSRALPSAAATSPIEPPRPAPERPAVARAPQEVPRGPAEPLRRPRAIELSDDVPPSRGGGLWVASAGLIATVAVGGLYFATQRPELVDSWLGRGPTDASPDAAIVRPPEPEVGILEVGSTPERAEVFLFVGRGPVVVEDLPRGVAHEFLVMADGHRPQRVMVPADAEYEDGTEGARYELAAQVGAALEGDETSVDLGPSLMPRNPRAPGDLASVRVITNPPGAKVFLLVGFTPDVRVENLSSRDASELLLWLEGHELERIVVGPSDWQREGGALQARVRASLRELRRR